VGSHVFNFLSAAVIWLYVNTRRLIALYNIIIYYNGQFDASFPFITSISFYTKYNRYIARLTSILLHVYTYIYLGAVHINSLYGRTVHSLQDDCNASLTPPLLVLLSLLRQWSTTTSSRPTTGFSSNMVTL
jgi:hypothetical protein